MYVATIGDEIEKVQMLFIDVRWKKNYPKVRQPILVAFFYPILGNRDFALLIFITKISYSC